MMKKILMAAVALICMTMTCVLFTSCGDDDTTPPANKEYTLKVSLEIIKKGELSDASLQFLKNNFENKQITSKFTGDYDAQVGTDNTIDRTLENIAQYKAYAKDCEYKIYYKLYNSNNVEVYKKTVYFVGDTYKVSN